MDSINVPVPGRVRRLAADHRPALAAFDRVREDHSMVCKRFERQPDRRALDDTLAGTPAFEAAAVAIDFFTNPPRGSAPVLYLVVESPGLATLHRRLVERFGTVAGLEGDDYTPHVTLARGGTVADAERLAGPLADPVTWTVSRLLPWNAERRVPERSIPLPA
ncbi:MAG: 2''-5'' RNA ligase superfamily [uncultured archaeon A07HB70]|nr:MAG: 2''-5'' RNA ligase superfamily [uncultured archaeon A07HB70]